MAEDISFVRLLPEDEDELALNEQSMDGSGPASSSFILPRTPVGDSTPPSLTALIDEGRRSSASPCPRDPKGQYPTTADLADFLRHTEPQIREHGSNSSLLSLYKRNESLRPRDLWPSKFSTRLLQSVQANLPSSPLREKGNFPSTKAVQKFSTTGRAYLEIEPFAGDSDTDAASGEPDAQTPPRLSISRSGDVKLVGPDAPSSWFADLDSSWTRVAKDNPTFSGDHDSALPSRFWTPTEVSWRGASSATNVSETDQPERRSSNKFPDHEIRQPRDSVHGAQASSQTTLDGALRQLKAVIALQHQPKDPIDPFTTQAVEKKAVVHSLASASAPASRPVTAELDFVLSEATCQDHPQTGKSDMVCADRTSKDGLKIRWAPSVVHVQTAVKETHRSGSVRSATFPVIPASADLPLEQPLTSSHSHAEITSLLTPFNTPSSADGRQAQWSPMQALQAQPWSPTALDGSSASPVAGSPKSHNTTTLLTRDEPRSPLNLYRSTFGGTSWHSSAPPASPTGPAPPGLASQLALAPPGPPPSKLPPSPPKPVKGRSSKGQTENTVQKKDGLKQRNDVLARKNNLLSRSNDHLTRENQLLEAALVAVLKTNGRLNGCPCGSEGGVGSCRETHGPVPRSFF